MLDSVLNRNHSFSTYEKFSEKLTFLTLWYLNVWVCIRGVRNVSFPENFAYVLNVWFYASGQQQADVEILKTKRKKFARHNQQFVLKNQEISLKINQNDHQLKWLFIPRIFEHIWWIFFESVAPGSVCLNLPNSQNLH